MITINFIGIFIDSKYHVYTASTPPRMLEGVASTNPAEPPSLTFNWLVPNVTNGNILDYSLTCVSEGIPTPPSVTSTTTSATISNLENGLRYCCTVTARNAQGNSMPSKQQCISTIEIGKLLSILSC